MLAGAAPLRGSSESEALRRKGFHLAYNLDHDEAMALLLKAVAADPNDPAAHRSLAAVIWLHILFRRGAVTVDSYLGRVTKPNINLEKPPPDLDAMFRRHAEEALALAERRTATSPSDVNARYELGAAAALVASYMATVDGRLLGGLRAGRRAYKEHEKALELDAQRKDAALVVGTYRYIVSSLPWHIRVLAYLVGFGGGKEEGLRLIEQAAAYPSEAQAEARFGLVLLYNRERRYADALRVLQELKRLYPRNRLIWFEEGATELRAGRAAAAEAALLQGLERLRHDHRMRMFGEEALWRHKLGAIRVALGKVEEARHDLEAVLKLEAHNWVRGRTYVELGKLADLTGDRPRARGWYGRAIRLCRADNDGRCLEEAQRLHDRGYKKSGTAL